MPELAAPLGLLGLVAVPLVWWLHRFQASERRVWVSALFLWRRVGVATDPGRQRTTTDPRWRRRAASVALLALALAGPYWPQAQRNIIVWVDDSFSMQAVENGVTRMALGQAKLLNALSSLNKPSVSVRRLSHPAQAFALHEIAMPRWRTVFISSPPPAALLKPTAEHWLVSDGANLALADWLRTAPINRLIQIGEATENVAITRFSMRPSLTDPRRLEGLVQVVNLGYHRAQRELSVVAGLRVLARWPLVLAPGETAQRWFSVRFSQTVALTAQLDAQDALPLDDRLPVQTEELGPVAIAVQGDCGAALHTALTAHPRLRQVSGPALLTIACGTQPPARQGPLLWVHPAGSSQPIPGVPYWRPAAGSLSGLVLERQWLRAVAVEIDADDTQILLAADDMPLIRMAEDAQRIELLLDMAVPVFTRRPEYPMLVAGLVERVLERPLMAVISQAQRDPAASVIAPHSLSVGPAPQARQARLMVLDLTPYLILLCALLVLVDLLRVGAPLPLRR